VQSGPDSRLYRAERLVQPRSYLGIRQLREERRLDRVSLAGREDSQRAAQGLCLLLERNLIAGIGRGGCRQRIAGFRLDALFPLVVPQPVDGAGACLVHDPPQNGPVRLLVARGAAPDIVEDIQCHLLGGLAVGGDSHHKRKNGAIGPFV
jgi:hypothetical protein